MNRHITCKQAVNYILKKEERKLSAVQRFRLWRHIAGCSLCRIFSIQNKLLTKAYQLQEDEITTLSQKEKEKIIEAVQNESTT